MQDGPDIPKPLRPATDRDARRILSSKRIRTAAAPALILVSVAAAAATLTLQQDTPSGGGVPGSLPAASAASAGGGDALAAERDPLWPAIRSWDRLRQSDRLPFGDYAAFLIAHRGWPGEQGLRRAAERQIPADGADPQQVVAFFAANPPLTNTGKARYADALAALGQTGAARDAAADAWTSGALANDDEARLTTRFGAQFTPAEQDRRMEKLLWDRTTGSAARQLPLVSAARRPLYAARLAFQTKAADAAMQGVAAGPEADRDAGFLIDRALWLRDSGQGSTARTYLAQAPVLVAPPADAQRYLETLLTVARAAATDNQPTLALAIASRAPGAFAAGIDVGQRPLAERDPYTSLVWLGGTQALRKLQRPADAERLFALYQAASQSPGSRAKGDYWGGRAADAAGQAAVAQAHYASAARNMDQFYGQLATEKLGRSIAVPPDPARVEVPAATRAAFDRGELVRAARLLGQHRDWQDQTAFVRTIAQNAKTDVDHVLADDLATAIRRPDLAVMVSRTARASGARDPIRAGFPTVPVPPAMETHWTMVHAITRQESQFDREALSGAGAHGLMQLMNATAKEQAGKLGLPWNPARLTEDPAYNVMIGSAFFDRMLTYYRGSYVLAVASYNAGPGNVNRFMRDNGDPRTPGIDVIDWIEAIPLSETRAYVQKVLENAVVYDLFNPARAKTPEKDRLSFYLNAGRAS